MSIFIGIRHEDKYANERRAPLTPRHIEKLVKNQNLDFVVESSPKRVFSDQEYKYAGASISPNLKSCQVILGVKEIPESYFEQEKTYVFFSHVIKGQSYNMPMLKRMMQLKCNLIDYERVVDEQNKRLIFFGKYAGLAGMINSLWALGVRLQEFGHQTPFLRIKQAHKYHSLAEAKESISEVGHEIATKGIHPVLLPLVIGFTGYGNVSQGAQEIAGWLPIKEISPEELLSLKNRNELPNNIIYKVVFKEEHISRHKEGKEFDLQDYYTHPEQYENNFEQFIPHLSLLINGMYWDSRYPRIVTKDYLEKSYKDSTPKLVAIGDITCDPDGSIECTHKGTDIEDPVFVYNPLTRQADMGFKGNGILIMAVDILPSELPRDSSMAFADALMPFIKPIAAADYGLPYEEINLPQAIKKALILAKGELTPDYKYLEKHLL